MAKKELRKEEHNFNMAVWLHKCQPLLFHLDLTDSAPHTRPPRLADFRRPLPYF